MPLDRGCSTDAMSKNIKMLVDKEGKPQKQAVAIGYAVLKKACGVKGSEPMTPKQIVGGGKKETAEVRFGSDLVERQRARSQRKVREKKGGAYAFEKGSGKKKTWVPSKKNRVKLVMDKHWRDFIQANKKGGTKLMKKIGDAVKKSILRSANRIDIKWVDYDTDGYINFSMTANFQQEVIDWIDEMGRDLDNCPVCGGSGGGEGAYRCSACGGTGTDKRALSQDDVDRMAMDAIEGDLKKGLKHLRTGELDWIDTEYPQTDTLELVMAFEPAKYGIDTEQFEEEIEDSTASVVFSLEDEGDELEEGASKSLKKAMKLKATGEEIPVGTKITKIEFTGNGLGAMLHMPSFRKEPVKVSTIKLPRYVKGIAKVPSTGTMMKWFEKDFAKTVTGKKTEPDGFGPDGSPSWMLVLGYI